jgi:hypothetical protein
MIEKVEKGHPPQTTPMWFMSVLLTLHDIYHLPFTIVNGKFIDRPWGAA